MRTPHVFALGALAFLSTIVFGQAQTGGEIPRVPPGGDGGLRRPVPVTPPIGGRPEGGPARGTIRSVTLERTRCFGACPAYKITLAADGTASYEGIAFAPRTGKFRGKTWGGQLERLLPILDRVGFWRMNDRYLSGATDLPSQTVTIVTDRGKKSVYEYGMSGPEGLWEVQTLIDGLGANVRDWQAVK